MQASRNAENIIMTIDAGERKSGYCVYDVDRQIPVYHGYVVSSDTEKMFQDLFAIAALRNARGIAVELSHRDDSVTVRLRRIIKDVSSRYLFPVSFHTAAEWRQVLHFYSKKGSSEEYKDMALSYVEKKFPEHYREDMPDDEAEAVCIAVAWTRGLPSHRTNKERRNESAQIKKNYFKQGDMKCMEEGDCDESAEFRKFFR